MTDLPKRKIPGPGKSVSSERGVPVWEVIPMATRGADLEVSIKAKVKRNYLPAEGCSTISDSDISSDKLSELFSDTFLFREVGSE